MNREFDPLTQPGLEAAQLDVEAKKKLEVLQAFRYFLNEWNVNNVQDIIASGQRNIEEGRKGVTVPGEDGSSWITVDEEVSFRIKDDGPYLVTVAEAMQAIGEVLAEQQELPPQPLQD